MGYLYAHLFDCIYAIYFQWDDFKSNSNEGNKHDVVQVIELIHQSDVIKVNQTIEELQNKTYQLTFPERGANFVCFNETGTEACSANYEVKNNQIKVEYEIPTDSKQNAFLLDHWLPQIEDVEISETIVIFPKRKRKHGSRCITHLF